jgi:hypothetical protein
LLKQSIPFEDWQAFFETNPTVIVNAAIRAASYKGKKYVQIVPTAIKEIKLENMGADEHEMEFFDL